MGLLARIAGRFGSVSSAQSLSAATSVVPVLSLWEQFNRQSGNQTPQTVSQIILEADGGNPSRLVDLSNDLRQKDGHLHATLSTRENALSALPLTIDPFLERGEREPSDQDAEIAGFVQDAFEGAAGNGQDIRSLYDLVPHLNGAVYHGYSNAETAWVRDGRWLLPEGFRLIDQRRFAFRSNDSRLVFKDSPIASAYAGGVDLMAEFPGQFLQHQPRINGDVPCREGLSHLLVWPATFRNWDIIDWLRLAELAWKPWRIGRLKGKAGKEDRDRLVYVLERLTNAGIAVIGENADIELLWPGQEGGGSRSGSTHKELADWLGAEMSKAILGQTLTTEQGTVGSYSLGKVHDQVRKDIRDQDAKAVAATLRRDLVRPLVLLNYGPNVPLPNVAFQTEDATDLNQFSEAVTKLKDAGLPIPLWYVYDVTGIPQPQEDDEVLGEGDESDEEDVDMTGLEEDEPDEELPDGEPVEEESTDEE